MSLRAKLLHILPTLLPAREEDAIKGKELIARVRAVLGDAYSDYSLRSQFSFMALDPDSCLARVPNGQGYYLRRTEDAPSLQNMFTDGAEAEREGSDELNKAMALAVRLYDTAGMGVFVYPVDGEESWEHPDLVAVQWPAGHWEADGAYVMQEGETDLSYRAVCVGFADSAEDARRAFFRALACGRWAQESELLLLVSEAADMEEWADLAARYGVGIRALAVAPEELPRANELFRMDSAAARELLGALPQVVTALPRRQTPAEAAAAALPDTAVVRQWAQQCVQKGRIEAVEQRVAVN